MYRKYLEKLEKLKNVSNKYVDNQYNYLKSLDNLQQGKIDYQKSNPLESTWEDQYGQRGISVQINFKNNSYELPKNVDSYIKPLLNILSNSEYKDLIFSIEGHSDSTGDYEKNLVLSKNRAKSLVNYLVKKKNIDPNRLEMKGYGPNRPLDSNQTDEGRQKNRRVEMNLLGNTSKPALVTTGHLTNDVKAISADGLLLLSSNGDVWDTKNWIKLYSIDSSYNRASFSPNSKYIYVNTDGYVSALLDARTGILIDFIKIPSMHDIDFSSQVIWSLDSSKLVMIINSFCVVYDIKQKKVTRMIPVPIAGRLSKIIAWIKGGSHIAVTGYASNGQVLTVNIDNGKIRSFKVPYVGWIHMIASSKDARYLYISDDQGFVTQWDTIKDTLPPKVEPFMIDFLRKGGRFASKRLHVHPAYPHIVAVSCFHSSSWGIIDFKQKKIWYDKVPNQSESPSTYWGLDGKELLITGGWVANQSSRQAMHTNGLYKIQFDPATPIQHIKNHNLTFIKGASAKIKKVLAFESLKNIVVVSTIDLSIWDITTGKQIHQWPIALDQIAVNQTKKSNMIYGVFYDNKLKQSTLYSFNLQNFQMKKLKVFRNMIMNKIVSRGHMIYLAGGKYLPPNQGSEFLHLFVFNAKKERVVAKNKIKTLTEKLKYKKITGSEIHSLAVSPSGKEIAYSTRWKDGYGYGFTRSKKVRFWNWKKNKNTSAIEFNENTIDSLFYETNQVLRVSANAYWSDWLYKKNEKKKYEVQEGKKKSKKTRMYKKAYQLDQAFTNLNLQVKLKKGMIQFINRRTNTVAVTIFKKGKEWIVYTPDNYFVASHHGTDKVFWKVGNRMLAVEQIRSQLEKPLMIQNAIKSIFNQQKKKKKRKTASNTVAVNPEVFQIPYQIKLVSLEKVETTNSQYTMKLDLQINDQSPLPQFLWSQNGHTIRGKQIKSSKKSSNRHLVEYTFKLKDGMNILSGAIEYKNATMMPQIVVIHKKTSRKSSSKQAINPKLNKHLCFFGVGVKEYENSKQNLKFPDRDAIKLAELFHKQQGKLFKKVHSKVLTNEEATVRTIQIELNRFLKQASAEDVVIIFIAGHGITDSNQNLYFMAHDSNLDEAYTGLNLKVFPNF